ncbi:MAG: tail fiber domain-containing protein [Bacteroidales bacterium]|nr:tail fiber domain-containing protein [Bacteroidales bacterium]
MKKTILLTVLLAVLTSVTFSQVAINETGADPDPSAILDLSSFDKGFLVPRVSTSERNAIGTTQGGLLVYDIETESFWYYNNMLADWVEIINDANNNSISDADNDTYITTEQNYDEDTIRIYINGIEKWRFSGNTLEALDNGYSVFIGEGAGVNTNLPINRNVFIGSFAGHGNTVGDGNVAIGQGVMPFNSSGSFNVAVGMNSLYLNTGEGNSAFGESSLVNSTEGNRNTAIGKHTMLTNVSGSYNTALGYNADVATEALENSTAIGNGSIVTASNQVRIGNSNVSSIGGQVDWTTLSDGRFKTDIQENVAGLDFILNLRPVTYKLDKNSIDEFLDRDENEKTNEKAQIIESGFIAQEVEQAAKNLGFEFSGIDVPQNESDYYGLRYAQFTVPLVKAIQEQQKIIEELKARIEQLETNKK